MPNDATLAALASIMLAAHGGPHTTLFERKHVDTSFSQNLGGDMYCVNFPRAPWHARLKSLSSDQTGRVAVSGDLGSTDVCDEVIYGPAVSTALLVQAEAQANRESR